MAKIDFRLNIPIFIFAFCLGMLYVYLVTPTPSVVIKYPTPFNSGKITYVDNADNCFQFSSEEIECPSDKSKIKPQPIISSASIDSYKI